MPDSMPPAQATAADKVGVMILDENFVPLVELADGSTASYDGLIMATGAAPRELPDQSDHAHAVVLRTLDDALTLADGDEFGVLLLLSSTSAAPGAGTVFSESDFSHTASLALSSSRGTVVRVLSTIVPEPASFLLLLSGLLAFAYARSRPVTTRPQRPSR